MSPKTNSRINTGIFAGLVESATSANSSDAGISLIDMPVGTRIEYLPLDCIHPDPIQPRRILPPALYKRLYEDHWSAHDVLKELIKLARLRARQQGRPFTNVLELIDTSDGEGDSDNDIEAQVLSPEENLLNHLVHLALSIRDDGQVNPITVVDVTKTVAPVYRIETGEMRYWATWILRDFIPDYEGNSTIPCFIVARDRASIFRQAKENTLRKGLTAVSMARQAALLLFEAHGIERPEGSVSNDFYRQALSLDLRGKGDAVADILVAMGGIKKARFSQYKALLQLSDEALEIADHYDVDEGRLRHILKMPPEQQEEMVRHIVQFGWTGKTVEEQSNQENLEDDQGNKPPKEAYRFANMMRTVGLASGKQIAHALLDKEQDINVVFARLETLKERIAEAEEYLRKGTEEIPGDQA